MSDINKYKNILLKIYNNYIFLGLSYEKFETIALNFSSESFKNKESFEKQLTSFLDKYVKNEINKNPKIIEKYIDANYKNFENYGKCYNFMKTFITFLETYEFNFDYEIVEALINNTILNKVLKIIADKHKNEIYEDITNVFTGNMLLFMEPYCIINGLIKEEDLSLFDEEELISDIEKIYKNENEYDEKDKDDDTSKIINDPVKMFLKDMGKIPLLTIPEEHEMLKRISEGEKELINVFAEHNLRLVVSIAKKFLYDGNHIFFLDLIQEGNIGLLKAIDKYDIKKGYRFGTYATWWIRQAIERYIYNNSRTIRIPVHMLEKIRKIENKKRELEKELGREVTIKELAEELKLKEETVIKTLKSKASIVSLEKKVGEDEDSYLGDFIPSNIDLEQESINELVREEMIQLLGQIPFRDKRAKDVLMKRLGFYDGRKHSLTEVGKELDITRERVRQIQKKAIEQVKYNPKYKRLFAEFTDHPEDLLRIKETNDSVMEIDNSEEKPQIESRKLKSIYDFLPDLTEQEVDKVIEGLSDTEKNLLILRYGNDFKNPVFNKLPEYEKRGFYNLITRIRKKTNENNFKIETINESEEVQMKKGRKPKTIYENLSDWTIQEVDEEIERLSDEEKKLLILRYGRDFKNPIFNELTEEEYKKFYTLLFKIRRKLKKDKLLKVLKEEKIEKEFIKTPPQSLEERAIDKVKKRNLITIFELLNSTEEKIRQALLILTEEELKIFYKKYGEDLKGNKDFNGFSDEEKSKYKKIITKIKRKLNSKSKDSLFEYLQEYGDEAEIRFIYSTLKKEEKDIIHQRFGEDLKGNPTFVSYNEEQRTSFYNVIIPKMKRRLKKNKENGSVRLYNLNDTEQKLKPSFNTKKEIPEEKEKVEEKIEKNTIIPSKVKEKNSTNNYVSTEEQIKLLQIIKSKYFQELFINLNPTELSVITLKLGLIHGKKYATKDIANALNISEEYVNEITKTTLLKFKKRINELFDELIDQITEQRILKNIEIEVKLKDNVT